MSAMIHGAFWRVMPLRGNVQSFERIIVALVHSCCCCLLGLLALHIFFWAVAFVWLMSGCTSNGITSTLHILEHSAFLKSTTLRRKSCSHNHTDNKGGAGGKEASLFRGDQSHYIFKTKTKPHIHSKNSFWSSLREKSPSERSPSLLFPVDWVDLWKGNNARRRTGLLIGQIPKNFYKRMLLGYFCCTLLPLRVVSQGFWHKEI